MLDKKILAAIGYHTKRISKIFKLKSNDRDDIRQTLYLAALEANQTYDPSRGTKKSTYLKAAVVYRAVDIMRNLEKTPQVVCYEEGDDLQATAKLYQKTQRDVHEELSNPDAPKLRKPVQMDCGAHIQTIAVAPETSPSDLKMDLLAVFDDLQPRQRWICLLLLEDFTYKEIAARLGIHKNTVQREIMVIRQFFIEHHFEKYLKK